MRTPTSRFWIGHLLTVILAVVGVATSYGALSNRVNGLEERLETLERNLMPMLKTLERDIGEVKVKVAEIGVDVRWLKSSDPQENK